MNTDATKASSEMETETTSPRPPPDWHTAEVNWPDELELHTPLCVQANLSGPTAHKVKPHQIHAVIATQFNMTDTSKCVVGHYRFNDPRIWYMECTTQTIKSTLLRLRGLLIGGKDMLVFSEPGVNLIPVTLGSVPLTISRAPVKLAHFTEMIFPGVKCAKPATNGSLDEVKILIVNDGQPIRHFYNVTDALGNTHRIRATVPGRLLACDRCFSADHKSNECPAPPVSPTSLYQMYTKSATNQLTKEKSTIIRPTTNQQSTKTSSDIASAATTPPVANHKPTHTPIRVNQPEVANQQQTPTTSDTSSTAATQSTNQRARPTYSPSEENSPVEKPAAKKSRTSDKQPTEDYTDSQFDAIRKHLKEYKKRRLTST